MKKIINICLVLLLITIQYSCKEDWEKKSEQAQELLEQVNELCDDQKFGEAHTAANKILAIYKPEHSYSWAKENLLTCYFAAEDVIFTRESQFLIAHIDEKDAIDKICYLLTGLPMVGTCYPEGTTATFDILKESEIKDYSRWTSWYNQKCDALLSLAIGLGNEGLAKRIIPLFKDDYTFGNHVVISNKTKTAAKQKYAEAFNNNIL